LFESSASGLVTVLATTAASAAASAAALVLLKRKHKIRQKLKFYVKKTGRTCRVPAVGGHEPAGWHIFLAFKVSFEPIFTQNGICPKIRTRSPRHHVQLTPSSVYLLHNAQSDAKSGVLLYQSQPKFVFVRCAFTTKTTASNKIILDKFAPIYLLFRAAACAAASCRSRRRSSVAFDVMRRASPPLSVEH
jgi:hypothetical protein